MEAVDICYVFRYLEYLSDPVLGFQFTLLSGRSQTDTLRALRLESGVCITPSISPFQLRLVHIAHS